MDSSKNISPARNPIVIKGDIFSEYLNCNTFQNSLLNQEFAKPDNETFDKFFNNDDNNSLKSINSLNEFTKSNMNKLTLIDPQIPEQIQLNNSNIINGGQFKIMNEENINNELNNYKNKDKDNLKKKNLFSTFPNNEISAEDLKQKKLLMNRQSAKKSRLKKKNYIENLEKQYILLKEEYIKIIENNKLNKNKTNINQILSNENEFLIANKNIKLNNINDILIENEKEKILKKNEKALISNDLLKDEEDNITNNLNNQKKLLSYLLINQIDIMTPIKIKAFQNKFLKLQLLDVDDSIDVIKNKINMNLTTIIELYGIEDENNIPNINICNKKKSMAYQLYNFYKDINSLVNKFEIIYKGIGNI